MQNKATFDHPNHNQRIYYYYQHHTGAKTPVVEVSIMFLKQRQDKMFKYQDVMFIRMFKYYLGYVRTVLDSTYHQSQLNNSWLKMVPLGQRKDTG